MTKIYILIIRLLQRIIRFLNAKIIKLQALRSRDTAHITLVQEAMDAHDMVKHPDELYYSQQYLLWLQNELKDQPKDISILDIGCGQGRLTLPLAKLFAHGQVVGVDFTLSTIQRAKEYAEEQQITNAEFYEADGFVFTQNLPSNSQDVVLFLEVVLFMPNYIEMLKEISRVLKVGGLLFVSFRSQYFNLLHSVNKRDWDSADLVVQKQDGYWGNGSVWYSWHTTNDIKRILEESGFSTINLRGIGITSGIEGDPLSTFAQPSKLNSEELEHLMEIETSLAEQYADCGRYILAIAKKD